MHTVNPNRLWNIEEVADYLGISVDTMRHWRTIGEGPICCRIGKHLRYRVADVLAMSRGTPRQVTMGSIVKRSNGKWRARYRDLAGREHARHFARKVDAQRWLDEVSSLILAGAYVDPDAGKITFAEWWTAWSARQTWTHSTRETADLSARSVTFGDVPLRSLKRAHTEEWVKAMTLSAVSRKQGLAASTIRTRFNYVHMALRAAVRDRLIIENPAERVKTPKQRRRHVAMTIPSPDQVAKALDAAPREFRAFVALCAFAGLRLGEAAAIRATDIDATSNILAVRRQVQARCAASSRSSRPRQARSATCRSRRASPTRSPTTPHRWAPTARRAGSSSPGMRC